MFFLGASANILIYFLVPVFFALYFYFNLQEKAESVDFVTPVVISYTAPLERNENLCVNFSEVLCEEKLPEEVPLPAFIGSQAVVTFCSPFYPGTCSSAFSLRAPPFLLS